MVKTFKTAYARSDVFAGVVVAVVVVAVFTAMAVFIGWAITPK